MIESIRKEDPSVLLLDCGAVFDRSRDTVELHLKAMERMGYDALNLGSQEFAFGKEFLEYTHSSVSFPYIASNLLYRGSKIPWTREYVIKEVGGIKVAILGVFNPDDLTNMKQTLVAGLEVIPPETALKRLLPEVRGKADLVILLSRFDVFETFALANAAKGVDVAISSGSDAIYLVMEPENFVLLQTGAQGEQMGLLKISLDEKQALSVNDKRYVSLDGSVPGNAEIERLVEKFKKDQKGQTADLHTKKLEKIQEGLQGSPEEFMERYRKEQTEMRKWEK
jgi:5'-nucleotidase / UDP-sugar diphosphatase